MKNIKNLLLTAIAITSAFILIFSMFIGAVIQTSERIYPDLVPVNAQEIEQEPTPEPVQILPEQEHEQTPEAVQILPEQTAEPEQFPTCTVTGYRDLQFSPDCIISYAVAIDQDGNEYLLDVSDAIPGDTYTIRHGTIIEQTYEGYSDEWDRYLIQFENGDIHEIISDDLIVGDEATTFFYNGRAVTTLYGWR